MADTVYISDGPTLDGAVKVSGNGPGQTRSSQTTSLSGPGASGRSQLEDVTVGSMPVVNTLTVETNKDGTIGIQTSVADAMPETGPGASSRNGSASANTGNVSSVGVQSGWVQIGDSYKYYKEDGSGYKTGWHFEYNTDGSKIWYYFDEELDNKEWMVTGWKKIVRGDGVLSWYHFRVDGKMSRYWEYLKGMWYYLEPRDDAGYMVTDWQIINGEYYYFIPDDDAGYMMIGWHKIRDKWYYFYNTDEKRGMMAYNYLMRHTDGELYFLQEKKDGSMAVNKQITDPATGIVYDANEYGVCTKVSGSAYALSGSSNEEKIWNYLTQYRGLSDIAAAGVMGNIKAESGFDPFKAESGGGGGWGLIQWTPARNIEIPAPKSGMTAGATSGNVDDYLLWQLEAIWPRGLNRGGNDFWINMNAETSVGSYTNPPAAKSAQGTQFCGKYQGLGSAYYFHAVVEASGDMNWGLKANGVPNGSQKYNGKWHGNILLRPYYAEQILEKY